MALRAEIQGEYEKARRIYAGGAGAAPEPAEVGSEEEEDEEADGTAAADEQVRLAGQLECCSRLLRWKCEDGEPDVVKLAHQAIKGRPATGMVNTTAVIPCFMLQNFQYTFPKINTSVLLVFLGGNPCIFEEW